MTRHCTPLLLAAILCLGSSGFGAGKKKASSSAQASSREKGAPAKNEPEKKAQPEVPDPPNSEPPPKAEALETATQPGTEKKEEELFRNKTLDGVSIEAVETYINPKNHEFYFGVGLFPFNPYYDGLSANGSYTYYLSNTFAWEVLSASYAFSIRKGLVGQLAEIGYNPAQIEKLQYALSTTAVYSHTYGKAVMFKNFIQYFRSGLFGGIGILRTSQRNQFTVVLGLKVDAYINEKFSWRLEVRDHFSLTSGTHFVAFNLGIGMYF